MDTVVAHVEGDIRHVQEVIGKIFFYDIAFVTTTYYEVIDAMMRVCF